MPRSRIIVNLVLAFAMGILFLSVGIDISSGNATAWTIFQVVILIADAIILSMFVSEFE